MVNFEEVVEHLCSKDHDKTLDSYIASKGDEILGEICDCNLKMVDYVKGMNPILTNGGYEVRAKGVNLLVYVITRLPKELLNEKEIETLTEFMCLRLIDHKSMEQSALACLSYFVDCDNKPSMYNKQLVEFLKNKSNPQRMGAKTRNKIYHLLKKIVVERLKVSNLIDGDLIYSLVSIIEGENNPENILLCFGLISFILKNFQELEPYIDDIFEWLSNYYPVDYSPTNTDDSEAINIQRSDLVNALYDCFYATPLNSDNLQTMLLEKLDSNVMSSKLESLECLIRCYEQFPLSSIGKYNSTLWTAIRMNCLRKSNTVDPKLMELSLEALTALAKRLAEDGEMYFTFISDMYEELAIAFRKPEMDLFEPAAKLLTHAILPHIVGFNYTLTKILTISLNALEANDLKPLSGLAYIFQKLNIQHPNIKLNEDLNVPIRRLLIKVLDKIKSDEKVGLILVESIICHRVSLEEPDLNEIITKLRELNDKTDLDVERCLALICLNYRRSDIICHEELNDYKLGSLVKLVHSFDTEELKRDLADTPTSSFPTSLSKIKVYLRLLEIQFDSCKGSEIGLMDQQIFSQSLMRMREIATALSQRPITEAIALVHSIAINKLKSENVSKILMDVFSSEYCQKLVPNDVDGRLKTVEVYLVLIKRIFKSLVVRNHQLAVPLINLFLNFITSDQVDLQLALDGSRVFSFVLSSEDSSFDVARSYKVFSLHKQKFYVQTSREIRLRYDKQSDDIKRDLLLCALALQLPHLPLVVYKRDYEWLVRQLLRVLARSQEDAKTNGSGENEIIPEKVRANQDLSTMLFGCVEDLVQRDLTDNLVAFLPSLIDLCLRKAQQDPTLRTRSQALICLKKIAASFNEQDLMVYRAKVVDELRSCLADKKRLVRQTAAEARLRWVIIGQPIGSM